MLSRETRPWCSLVVGGRGVGSQDFYNHSQRNKFSVQKAFVRRTSEDYEAMVKDRLYPLLQGMG